MFVCRIGTLDTLTMYISHPFDFDKQLEQKPKATKEIILSANIVLLMGNCVLRQVHKDEMVEKWSATVTTLEGEYLVGKIPMFEGKWVW